MARKFVCCGTCKKQVAWITKDKEGLPYECNRCYHKRLVDEQRLKEWNERKGTG